MQLRNLWNFEFKINFIPKHRGLIIISKKMKQTATRLLLIRPRGTRTRRLGLGGGDDRDGDEPGPGPPAARLGSVASVLAAASRREAGGGSGSGPRTQARRDDSDLPASRKNSAKLQLKFMELTCV